MEFFTSNILTIVTFTPAAGALLLLFYDREHARSIRISALIFTLLAFVFSLYLVARFDSSNPDFQFGLKVPWIRSLGIDYSMGVDGISLFLILLTTLLTPLSVLASWSIQDRLKEYFIFLLLLVAIIALYFIHGNATGIFTFSYPQIQSALASGRLVLRPAIELWLFIAFFLAFAIKVSLFPFHTWLPDAHVEAPTAGSVLLAGVLLK